MSSKPKHPSSVASRTKHHALERAPRPDDGAHQAALIQKTNDEAASALRLVRGARKHVDGFLIYPQGQLVARTLRFVVDPKFLLAVCDAVEQSPALRRVCAFDPAAAREALAFDTEYANVEREARALADGIHGARVARYTDMIDAADKVVRVARGLAAADLAPDLTGLVATMQRARAIRRRTATTGRRRARVDGARRPGAPIVPASGGEPAPSS
jgi:hypothetical protein